MSDATIGANRTTMLEGCLILPAFTLFGSDARLPHRRRVVARYVDGNGVEFEVSANYGRVAKRWWVRASKGGFRMTNTAGTSSPTIAAQWIVVVEAGNVALTARPKAGHGAYLR
jgi:hypothetical protein